MCILKKYQEWRHGITNPSGLVNINAFDIQNSINAYFNDVDSFVWDWDFYAAPLDEYVRFIKWDTTNFSFYVGDYHDCDDYAIALWGSINRQQNWSGVALGLAIVETDTSLHAINVIVTAETEEIAGNEIHKMYFIEPQNDDIWWANEPRYKPLQMYFS